MREFVALTCKRCGARITMPSEVAKAVCEYCGTEYYPEGVPGSKSAADRIVVVAGVLESYSGAEREVTLPDTVFAIGDAVFSGLELLESVTIPETVISIGDDAFSGCRSLRSIRLPAKIRRIGNRAFKGSGIEKIQFGDEIEYIGDEAFMECRNLRAVTLPPRLPGKMKKTFKLCSALTEVNGNLWLFAPSFRPSNEVRKEGDTRPTFFDIFQATPFLYALQRQYAGGKCVYCHSAIQNKTLCSGCKTKYYDGNQGCYIATAVYGGYTCPQVRVLRRYRDCVLAVTWYGRIFIRLYYALSPVLLQWFGRVHWFCRLCRYRLDHWTVRLIRMGINDDWYDDSV